MLILNLFKKAKEIKNIQIEEVKLMQLQLISIKSLKRK